MKANISRSLQDSIMREEKPVRLSLAVVCVCLLAMASASAADKSANMPTVNPYLHNSHNPISHENPAQTDAVEIASGTKGRTLGAGDAKVLCTVHRDAGTPVLVGLAWDTGIIKATWRMPTDSAVWGSYGNIIGFADDGDILAGGLFGIKRWNIGQDNKMNAHKEGNEGMTYTTASNGVTFADPVK